MTTYTAPQLRDTARHLREQADRILDDLKGIIDLADLLDGAAAGRVTEAELQAAVDANNVKAAVADASDRMAAAFDADDPLAWAAAAADWLPGLPENEARCAMYAFNDGLIANAVEAVQEFAAMPSASEVRQ